MAGSFAGMNRGRIFGIVAVLILLLALYLLSRSGLLTGPEPLDASAVVPLDKVRESVERLIEQNPESARGYQLLAQVENSAGNPVDEARLILRAIALEGEYPQGLFRLGKTYADLGQIDRAMRMAERGLATAPDDPDLTYLLASVLLMQGRGEEGSQVYRSLLEQMPDNPHLLANAAHHELMMGNMAEAKVLLLRYMGLKREPEKWHVEAAQWLGAGLLAHVFAREGDQHRALQLASQTVRIAEAQVRTAPETFYPYRRLAWAYAVAGNHGKALESLSVAVDKGYWGYWEFDYDPVWDDLRENPDFQALHERMRERRAALLSAIEPLS